MHESGIRRITQSGDRKDLFTRSSLGQRRPNLLPLSSLLAKGSHSSFIVIRQTIAVGHNFLGTYATGSVEQCGDTSLGDLTEMCRRGERDAPEVGGCEWHVRYPLVTLPSGSYSVRAT
jgi:hypothetical protein